MWWKGYEAPGNPGKLPHYLAASAYVTRPAAQASEGPVRPLAVPVQGLAVDGMNALGALSGVSVTPTLSWSSSPVSGTSPSGYRVRVIQVFPNSAGENSVKWIAEIATAATTVTLPPGLLQKDLGYVFRVSAEVSPVDVSTAPYRRSPTLAGADLLTGLIVP
jgi:hypothetical protein